ncbi:uncharacterized protein LOC128226909 isoform X2 [Mya arenaria]|uniref:uncharacterized protein LOC128226909 isoform X2 n=1 Tax=Mya arenaria TaxID=6604 RepID=UPI0022E7A914|nr:uncharacterized protein LOC128226909 isoform X2 [Mya arenaria]
MTVRYLRLLISDKVIAKCVIKSLPLGVRETPASTQNIPIKKRLSSRFCLRQKRSPIQYLHSKLKNFAVPRCLEKEKSTQVKPAAESEKCPSNNEDQSPPDSTEEEFPQPEVVLAGSVVSKTCQIPDQMQAEPITASKHQVYQQQVNPKAVEGTCQQASSNYVSMMSQLPFPYQHHIYPTAPGQLVAYPHMITNCTGPPLPWRPVPFLQTCAQSGPQVGAVATSESESLLDLSLKPGMNISTDDKHTLRRKPSNVGVAIPVKRSASMSAVDKNSVKSPKVMRISSSTDLTRQRSYYRTTPATSSVSSSSRELRSVEALYPHPPTFCGQGVSPHLLALHQLTSTVRGPAITYPSLLPYYQTTTPQVLAATQKSATTTNSSKESNVNNHLFTSYACALSKSQLMTVEPKTQGKSFPYRHQMELSNGCRPVAEISLEKNTAIENTQLKTLEAVGLTITGSNVSESNQKNMEDLYSNLSNMEMSRDPKTKQVKIKLDKTSSGHFLAELLKLQATGNITHQPLSVESKATTNVPISVKRNDTSDTCYRTPTDLPRKVLMPRSIQTVPRNLLFGNVHAPLYSASSKMAPFKQPGRNQYQSIYTVSNKGHSLGSVKPLTTIGSEYTPATSEYLNSVPSFANSNKTYPESRSIYSEKTFFQALKDRLTEVDSEIKTSTSGVMRRASDTDLVSFDGENMDLRKWTVANSSLTSEQGRITPRISEASIASTHWQTPMSIEKLELVPKPQLSIPTAEHTFSKQIQQSELGFTQPNSFFPDMPLTRSLSLGHLEASHIFSEPSSGTSSVHLSPYLLGMLPDKMTDSDIDSDDVFMS